MPYNPKQISTQQKPCQVFLEYNFLILSDSKHKINKQQYMCTDYDINTIYCIIWAFILK